MVDQNQTGSQINWQPVMGGNPYDLIDNKGQVNVEDTVQNVEVQSIEQVQQPVAQNVNIQTNNVEVPQQAQVAVVNTVQAPVYKWPSGFTKKLVGFIAKLSGQPDPETWAWVQKPVAINTTNSQAPVNTGADIVKAKNTNPFDAIMGWVTGFLDKVEKKVENVAGVDLNAPINKPTQTVQNNVPTQGIQQTQPTVTTVEPVSVIQEQPQQVVAQPVVEQKVEPVVQTPTVETVVEEKIEKVKEIAEPVVEEEIKKEEIVKEDASVQSNISNPSPDFGSIPTMDQAKPA